MGRARPLDRSRRGIDPRDERSLSSQPCRQSPVTAPDVEQPALAPPGIVQLRLECAQHMIVRLGCGVLTGQPAPNLVVDG
jgi:hypothetical protein